jgi:hypothetical protein
MFCKNAILVMSATTFKSMKETMDADIGSQPTCDWRGPADAIP